MTRDRGSALLSNVTGRKSTYSQDAACVEVAAAADCPWVEIRDSKTAGAQDVPRVVVPLARFRQFVNGLR
ncbi:DUF397 domain-containing protein [Saccharothrix sp. NPDC042600]|uniref:DUF397 domain-containing protein n=1 Tax=Saccharothrix TaxID=2071 RepID=UPI0033FA327F|nr:hypothetical protein GCM10017745_53690 [Saccharothrix mutabilis subsp. capreolus]